MSDYHAIVCFIPKFSVWKLLCASQALENHITTLTMNRSRASRQEESIKSNYLICSPVEGVQVRKEANLLRLCDLNRPGNTSETET